MSLVIHLPPAQETPLWEEAQKAGVSVNELVQRAIAKKFPTEFDENAQALRLIEQWIAEAPTTLNEVKEAEEDLRSFQRSLNQTRTVAGARLVYPKQEKTRCH